jgi:hypothetical protein
MTIDLSEEAASYHHLTLTARSAPAALEAVSFGLAASGAELRQLSLRTIRGLIEVDVRLADVSASSARALADRLAMRAGVDSVRVEHVWGRA